MKEGVLGKRWFGMGLFGFTLIVFSAGGIFFRSLIPVSYFVLLIGVLLVVDYVNQSVLNWHKRKETGARAHVLGFAGSLLMALLLGIQSPQVPFKEFILGFGIVITLPAIYNLFRRLRRV